MEFKWKTLDGKQVLKRFFDQDLSFPPSCIISFPFFFFLFSFALTEPGNKIQETCIANSCYELLSVLHMMALLTLMEASLKMMPEDCSSSGEMVVAAGLLPFPSV